MWPVYVALALVAIVGSVQVNKVSATTLENWNLDATYFRFAISFLQLVGMIVLGCAVGRFSGFPIGDLWGHMLTSASVVFGLASQNTLSNLAAGVQLVFARPFEVGDFIEVGGFSGSVTNIDFFHVRITTLYNEGVNIPNSTVVGGALVNYTENYEFANTGLRSELVELRVAPDADLEKAIEVLEEACRLTDQHISKLIADETPAKFANGTHSLQEFYRIKYGRDLLEDQKANPCSVFIGGQDRGLSLSLCLNYVQPIRNVVKPQAFRTAVRCLREAGISLYEPMQGPPS